MLTTRVCDLPLKIEDSWLEDCVNEVHQELDTKQIKFKPPCYLADEWLTPDNEPVVGIPFFLAHPALIKLEKKMMLDVEGGTKPWCMKLLRHEIGHALNYAYKLYKKQRWQKIFGKFSAEYEDTYRFRPYSKNFVRHLEDYYAQYHPDEDFSETFAVWLTPDLDWRTQYKGWRALEKLNYVDGLMNEIKNKPPRISQGKKYWEFCRMRILLKNYYQKRKRSCAENFPDFHDVNLKKIFAGEDKGKQILASDVIVKYRKEMLNNVSVWTGEKKYIINELLKTIIERCRALKLEVVDTEPLTVLRISTYIMALVMNYMYTGKFRVHS